MNSNNPMKLLLVEDTQRDADLFKNYISEREDVKLISIVNSSKQAIEQVKTHMPEGVILDITLTNGEGSGMMFLSDLQKIMPCLDFRPLVMVITNISSEVTHTSAFQNGADMLFYKLRDDFSPELVIENLLLMRSSIIPQKVETDMVRETISERKKRISDRISRELDLIGVTANLTGRKYIHDAILYAIENDKNADETAFQYLTRINKKTTSSVGKCISTAIEYAWRHSSDEELETFYTAKISSFTGVPTPTEFVYYYVDKLKKII